MAGFGWWRVYEGPLMLRPGTDIKLLHAKSRRCCEVCAARLQLAGIPMVFEDSPEIDADVADFSCHFCGAYYQQPRLRSVS